MKKCLHAISLLECLLSIIVIASISTMAVRYYMITIRDMRVSHAISQIKRITDASYEWLQMQKQADFSATSNGVMINLQALVSNELLTDPHDTVAPWGGKIDVAPGDNPSYIKIILNDIPQLACRNLTQQLLYINKDKTDNVCSDAKNNTFIGEF